MELLSLGLDVIMINSTACVTSSHVVASLVKTTGSDAIFNLLKIFEIIVTVHKPDTILKEKTNNLSVTYSEKFK